jgi:hypothetical protein
MKIFGLRYFSIKSQNTLFQLPDNLLPNQLFVYSLLQKRTLTYYGKNYTIRLIEQSNENSYLVGYFLKSVDLNLISLDEELFQEKEIENWEKVLFVVDQQLQIIAFEHNSGIAAPDNIQNVIELMVNAQVQQWGYVIKIEFIIDKFRFWSIIDKSSGIFQIAFKLNAPNLFGGSKKANAWLKELKEIHNMTSIAIDVKNENAALTYNREEIDSYRDYADSGGGDWTLTVLQENRKKKYKSTNHLRRSNLEVVESTPKFIRQNINLVIQKMAAVILKFND